jgi:hypothetical protein
MENREVNMVSNTDLDINAALSTLEELDLEHGETLEAIEDIIVSSDGEVDMDDSDEIELEIALTSAEIAEESAVKDVSPAPVKVSKRKSEPSEPVVRKQRSLEELDAKFFVLTHDEPADLEANKIAVMARKPGQKKVQEKFENVLLSLAVDKKPSIYVMQAFAALVKTGEITSNDLVKALTAHGMNESTARSQSGQIMSLFPALAIADRDGRTLKMRDDSLLVSALKLLLA